LIYRAFGRRDVDKPLKYWTEAGIGLKPTLVRHKEDKRKWKLSEEHNVKEGKE
jgi:hypothetical protein